MAEGIAPADAAEWMQRRLAGSDLIHHYFELRSVGLDASEGAAAVGALADVYVLGRCAALATVAARIVGRDRLVRFSWPDGRLAHAVLACTPQHPGEPLKGDCVDVLGRCSLPGMEVDLRAAIAPVTVQIGEIMPDDDFLDGEEASLALVCARLPWLRRTLLLPTSTEDAATAFLEAAHWVRAILPSLDDPPRPTCRA
jgi:hypothetical protein